MQKILRLFLEFKFFKFYQNFIFDFYKKLSEVLLFSCGGSKSSRVVSKYLKAESASDYETAYSLLSSVDRSVKSLAEYKEQENSEFELLFTEDVRKSTTFLKSSQLLDTLTRLILRTGCVVFGSKFLRQV